MIYGRIKDLREDNDKTQAEVAADIGLYTTTYQRYERGEREIPLDIAVCLAKYYNVSLDYLAGLIPNPRPLFERVYAKRKEPPGGRFFSFQVSLYSYSLAG